MYTQVLFCCFLEVSAYSNAGLFSPKLFIKKIFSYAKKLEDTFFLNLITFSHIGFIPVFVCMYFLLSRLKISADIVMLVC